MLNIIIEKGANIEAKDKYYQKTPLRKSCEKVHLPIVQCIIEKGTNIETKDNLERTPLHIACHYDHLPIVKYLIEKGANIEAKQEDNWTPLHYACFNNHLPIVQYLIENQFQCDESQFKHLKEVFLQFIKNFKIDSIDFINFINFYSQCRPLQYNISRELVGLVYSCFPEQIQEIQQKINRTNILKFIMFPEEFPIEENKEQKEMFLILQKDYIDGFISPTIDITKEQELEWRVYYCYLFDSPSFISLIDFCCFFGSLKCFKYLLLNKCEITEETLEYSIAGENQEIINILKENGHSFEECLETSVRYHRYELTNWLNENYKCEPVSLPTCIQYYNLDAFLYFLEHGHSIDEIDEHGETCLHIASKIGNFQIVEYLIEKGSDINASDETGKTPFYIACYHGHFPIIQYLIEKGANIEAYGIKLLFFLQAKMVIFQLFNILLKRF